MSSTPHATIFGVGRHLATGLPASRDFKAPNGRGIFDICINTPTGRCY